VCHDVWFEERAVEYLASSKDTSSSANFAFFILFLIELAILATFILDVLLNAVGYGLLYMKRVFAPLEAILTLANIALIVRMLTD